MHLQSSTLKQDETGEPFHIQQARQIRLYRQAWREAGHPGLPRVSISRSIFALVNDQDRAYFGHGENDDQIGMIESMRAIFGRTYAAEPDRLLVCCGLGPTGRVYTRLCRLARQRDAIAVRRFLDQLHKA